jgi:hypothetical protein
MLFIASATVGSLTSDSFIARPAIGTTGIAEPRWIASVVLAGDRSPLVRQVRCQNYVIRIRVSAYGRAAFT